MEWVRTATRKAEALMSQHNVEDWVKKQRGRQWEWAGKVASRTDNRWSHEVIGWEPPDARKRGRPRQRWHDAVNEFVPTKSGNKTQGGEWVRFAKEENKWKEWKDEFKAHERFSI